MWGISTALNSLLCLLISEILDKREGEGRGHWGSASCSWKQLTEALEKGAQIHSKACPLPLPLSQAAFKWAVCSVWSNPNAPGQRVSGLEWTAFFGTSILC